MWEINNMGNAINRETNDEIYMRPCIDGMIHVFFNKKRLAKFDYLKDAKKFIERKVEELNSVDK